MRNVPRLPIQMYLSRLDTSVTRLLVDGKLEDEQCHRNQIAPYSAKPFERPYELGLMPVRYDAQEDKKEGRASYKQSYKVETVISNGDTLISILANPRNDTVPMVLGMRSVGLFFTK